MICHVQPQTCEKCSFCCLSQRLCVWLWPPQSQTQREGLLQEPVPALPRPPWLPLPGPLRLPIFRLPLSRSPSLRSFARVAVKKDHKNGGLKQEKPFTGLEASGLKARCQQGRALSESSGRASFLPLPASSGSLAVAASLQPLPPSPHGLLPYVSASQISLSFLL